MAQFQPRPRITGFASLLVAGALVAACSPGHRSPTESAPAPLSAASQGDAIGSLDHPHPGDRVQVQVQLTQAGQSVTLTAQVRIVGPAGGGGGGGDNALQLDIQPNHWNTNWAHSHGTVTALLTGPDL